MADAKAPAPAKASASTEMVAEGVDQGLDREVMEVYKARKGWVQDTDGRFHEVDDVDRATQAYPGYVEVKKADVTQSKVGYAVPAEEVATVAAEAAAKVAEDAATKG